MFSKKLYSIIHYHHNTGQFIWPQTSTSTDTASNPTLPKDIFQTKQLHYPYDKPTCLFTLFSLLPSQHTRFQNGRKWVLIFSQTTNLDIIPDSSPLLSLNLLTLTFKKSLVYLSLFS